MYPPISFGGQPQAAPALFLAAFAGALHDGDPEPAPHHELGMNDQQDKALVALYLQ